MLPLKLLLSPLIELFIQLLTFIKSIGLKIYIYFYNKISDIVNLPKNNTKNNTIKDTIINWIINIVTIIMILCLIKNIYDAWDTYG